VCAKKLFLPDICPQEIELYSGIFNDINEVEDIVIIRHILLRGFSMTNNLMRFSRTFNDSVHSRTLQCISDLLLITLVFMFCSSLAGAAQAGQSNNNAFSGEGEHLSTYEQGDKWGFADKTGKIVIEPQFDHVDAFVEDRASVAFKGNCPTVECEEARWSFIDPKGKMIIEPILCNAWDFREGFAGVKLTDNGKADGSCENGKYGFIDRNGKIVIEPQYDAVNAFYSGLARVLINGLWGVIDKSGKIIIEPKYQEIGTCPFITDDRIWAILKDKCVLIDRAGKVLIEPLFDKCINFSEGLAGVAIAGKWGFVNEQYRLAIPLQFEEVGFFKDNVTKVKERGKWGIIDRTGKLLVPPGYDSIDIFSPASPDLFKVSLNGKWGLIKVDGALVVNIDLDDIGYPQLAGVLIMRNNKQGLIDITGKILIPPVYDRIEWLAEKQIAVVMVNGLYGITNSNGQELITPQFDFITSRDFASLDVARAGMRSPKCTSKQCSVLKYGIITVEGNSLIKPTYDYISEFHDGVARINIGGDCSGSSCFEGKWGVIDTGGKFLIKPEMDSISFLYGPAFIISRKENGKKLWGLAGKKGNIIVSLKYDAIDIFSLHSPNLFKVSLNGKWGLMKVDGTLVANIDLDAIGYPELTKAVIKRNNKQGLIDLTGKILISPVYDRIEWLEKKQIAVVMVNGLYGIANSKGQELITPQFDFITSRDFASLDVARAGMRSPKCTSKQCSVLKYGIITVEGNSLIKPTYDYISEFHDGVARINLGGECSGSSCLKGKWGLIDVGGKVLISPEMDSISSLDGPALRISRKENDKELWGLAGKKGNIILGLKYDFIGNFSEGLAIVNLGGKWGFIDQTGKFIIEPKYDSARDFKGGFADGRLNDKWGYVDAKGHFTKGFRRRQYVGVLGNKVKIHMDLVMNGDKLAGFYLDEKIGVPIKLQGTVSVNGSFTINGVSDDKKLKGIFKGKFDPQFQSGRGEWTTATRNKKLPFRISLAEEDTESITDGKLIKYPKINVKNPVAVNKLNAVIVNDMKQETYVSAKLSDEGKTLTITTDKGMTYILRTDPDQEDFSNVKISSNKHAVGWLIDEYCCGSSGPYGVALVIFKDGKVVHKFDDEATFLAWNFVNHDKAVAYANQSAHFVTGTGYSLRSISSGKKLKYFGCEIPDGGKRHVISKNVPHWVWPLRDAGDGRCPYTDTDIER